MYVDRTNYQTYTNMSSVYDCDSPSETSRRFRRDLLRRVHQELLLEAGQMPSPVEQELMQRVAQIVRRCESDLLNQAQPPTFMPGRRSSANSINSSYRATPIPEPAASSLVGPLDAGGRGQGYGLPDVPPLIPEPVVDWGHWEYPSYNPFGLGIDWEAAFPSASGMQFTGGDEAATSFLVPMRT
jgi:hypothetical protein